MLVYVDDRSTRPLPGPENTASWRAARESHTWYLINLGIDPEVPNNRRRKRRITLPPGMLSPGTPVPNAPLTDAVPASCTKPVRHASRGGAGAVVTGHRSLSDVLAARGAPASQAPSGAAPDAADAAPAPDGAALTLTVPERWAEALLRGTEPVSPHERPAYRRWRADLEALDVEAPAVRPGSRAFALDHEGTEWGMGPCFCVELHIW